MLRNISSILVGITFIASSAMALTHSVPRAYTGFECGTDYELKTCGVVKYDSCPSKTCADSYDSESWKEVGEWQCPLPFPQCDAARKQAMSDMCAKRIGGKIAAGSTYQSWGGGLFHYDTVCARQEFVASCENPSCNPLVYNYCPDTSKPIPKTCQLRKTQAEIEAYISTVTADIEYNAELYAANLGSFLARTQDKIQMACLIDKYYAKPQFAAIVGDLVDKYEANFGEIYESGQYKDKCESMENVIPQEVVYGGIKCSGLTSDQVRDGLKNSGNDAALKRFYNNCFSQKAYELPKNWFEFHLDEINLLLGDVVAASSAATKTALENLQGSLDSQNIASKRGH